jgi:hypothetical protein
MELPLLGSDEIPLPPDQIRFRSVGVSPYPDRTRVRLNLQITPFLERPNIEISIVDSDGQEAASAQVIENLDHALTLTMHLHPTEADGPYTARLALGYPDRDPVDRAEIRFTIEAAGEGGE